MSRKPCAHESTCFYCGTDIAERHEHEHWPVPARHDGSDTVPVCLTCHDLVDRQPLDAWPIGKAVAEVAALMESLPRETRSGRILLAKLFKLAIDRMPKEAVQ